MSIRFYTNAPATALNASISNSQTSMVVNAVTGLPIQYPYTLIIDRGTASEEAVSVTNASGTTLTVTRAIDSTTAFSHAVGATVEHGITAQDVREPNTHVNATSGVHGLAGALVGTTDVQTVTNKDLSAGNTFPSSLATLTGSQTLTNKTVALGSNTVSGTRAQFNTAMTDDDFVSLTGTETLTNKTLTSPKIGTSVKDTNGVTVLGVTATASAVNDLNLANAATGNSPSLTAEGTDTNIGVNLVPKGTGTVKANGVDVTTISGTQTLTNKTLTTPTITTPVITGSVDGATDVVRMVGQVTRNTDQAATTETQVTNVSFAAVNGGVYRIRGYSECQSNTAAAFTTLLLRTDTVSTGVTGTQLAQGIKDHRVASRDESMVVEGIFTASSTGTLFAKLTITGGGGTSTSKGTSTPTILTVERIA